MHLIASDFYSYYRPSKCDLRVYLRHNGQEEALPGPYELVLRRLAERHERTHFAAFPIVVDLSDGNPEDRETLTARAVRDAAPVIYQGRLRAKATVWAVQCEIVGEPDFLINDGGRYVVRDSKISRRITEQDHPEILRQLELYGWLFEQVFAQAPLRLEVHCGTGDIRGVVYDGVLQ